MSRPVCIVACFTGSALLHAIPQYISTRDIADSLMMAAFFLLQGVVLMIEIGVKRIFILDSQKRECSKAKIDSTGLMKRSDSIDAHISSIVITTQSNHHLNHNDKKGEADRLSIASKSTSGQFTTETIVVICLLSLMYTIIEAPLHGKTGISTAVLIISGSIAYLRYKMLRASIYGKTSAISSIKGGESLVGELLGWLWLLTTIFVLLPLFSIPILHSVEKLYSQSFVVGPVVRTLETILIS